MTQDEIIEMAKQVGVEATGNEYWPFFIEELMDFAKLVAEKAIKEALAQPEQIPPSADSNTHQPERHELQAKGEHPAPCARHCEANAFQIVIKNLKAQLAQPEQEPVAWQGVHDQTDLYYRKPPQADARPLYTTPSAPPPQRTWVGLTDDEIEALASWWPSYDQMPAIKVLIKDVTNSLKEKNQ